MISSYKGAIFEIWKILIEAQTEADNHSNAETRADILNKAIEECINIKKYYFGPYSKPRVIDLGTWHSIFDKEDDDQ